MKVLQELVEVGVKDFEVTSPLGTCLDYLDLLSEVSEAKGWLSPERSILVALEAPSNRQGQVELELKSLSQINLFSSQPMSMPSLIDENLRHAAIDRARDYLRSASQPVLVFIEDTKDPK